MDIVVKAPESFKVFLQKYEGEIMVQKVEAAESDGTYDANLTKDGLTILFNIFLGVSTNIITDAIQEYVKTTHKEVVVTVDEDRYIINESNVMEITPYFNEAIMSNIETEENGKIR